MTTNMPQLSRRVHRFLETLADLAPLPLTAAEAREILALHTERTNLDDALEIVREIDDVRSVVRELKAAFAKSELDGGAKAALDHPLYIQAQARLDELHDQLMMVI